MRELTPPPGHCPLLPDAAAQAAARRAVPRGAVPMLLASALLWAAVWGAWHVLPKTPPPPQPRPLAAQPLPVKAYGKPALAIALAEKPTPAAPVRRQQRLRTDLLALFGHVAESLVRDELDTMVLRLSLGQQVAVHLRQGYLD